MQHLDFTRNPEVDAKIKFCKDISNIALIEMSVPVTVTGIPFYT